MSTWRQWVNVLLTGASSGFGRYIYDRLKADACTSVHGVGLGGPDFALDFNQDPVVLESEFECVLRALYARGVFPDVLVLNAGITRSDFMPDHSLQDFNDVLRVNLVAPFVQVRAWLRLRREVGLEQKAGRVVFTSSMAATTALRSCPGYCASKAGLESMCKVFAKEQASKYPVTYLCVAPGGVDGTKMIEQAIEDLMRTRGMTREQAEKYNRQSPLGRNGTFDEVWRVFEFAIFNAPEYMSGTVLKMSGAFGV